MITGDVKIQEIGHHAEPDPIRQIAQGPAHGQAQAQTGPAALGTGSEDENDNRGQGGQGETQHQIATFDPRHESESGSGITDMNQVEKGGDRESGVQGNFIDQVQF